MAVEALDEVGLFGCDVVAALDFLPLVGHGRGAEVPDHHCDRDADSYGI